MRKETERKIAVSTIIPLDYKIWIEEYSETLGLSQSALFTEAIGDLREKYALEDKKIQEDEK